MFQKEELFRFNFNINLFFCPRSPKHSQHSSSEVHTSWTHGGRKNKVSIQNNEQFNGLMAHCIVMRRKRLQCNVKLKKIIVPREIMLPILFSGNQRLQLWHRMEFSPFSSSVFKAKHSCLWCNYYFFFLLLIDTGMCVITDKKLVAIVAAFLFNHFFLFQRRKIVFVLPSLSPSFTAIS